MNLQTYLGFARKKFNGPTPQNKGKNACQAPKRLNSLKPNHIAVACSLASIRYT